MSKKSHIKQTISSDWSSACVCEFDNIFAIIIFKRQRMAWRWVLIINVKFASFSRPDANTCRTNFRNNLKIARACFSKRMKKCEFKNCVNLSFSAGEEESSWNVWISYHHHHHHSSSTTLLLLQQEKLHARRKWWKNISNKFINTNLDSSSEWVSTLCGVGKKPTRRGEKKGTECLQAKRDRSRQNQEEMKAARKEIYYYKLLCD